MKNKTVSETLFHFTGVKDSTRGTFKPDDESFEILKQIITDRSFLMTSHKRSLKNSKGQEYTANIAMSCFSETPLEFLKGHVDVFGSFGIGVNTRWARKQNAHNVIYVDLTNGHVPFIVEQEINRGFAELKKFTDMVKASRKDSFTKGDGICDDFPDIVNSDVDIILGTTEHYCYRGEREWRIFNRTQKGKKIYTPQFEHQDIDFLICPYEFVEKLKNFIELEGFTAKVVPTEEL